MKFANEKVHIKFLSNTSFKTSRLINDNLTLISFLLWDKPKL